MTQYFPSDGRIWCVKVMYQCNGKLLFHLMYAQEVTLHTETKWFHKNLNPQGSKLLEPAMLMVSWVCCHLWFSATLTHIFFGKLLRLLQIWWTCCMDLGLEFTTQIFNRIQVMARQWLSLWSSGSQSTPEKAYLWDCRHVVKIQTQFCFLPPSIRVPVLKHPHSIILSPPCFTFFAFVHLFLLSSTISNKGL